MSVKLSELLDALVALGLPEVTVGTEDDGAIVVYTGYQLDEDNEYLVPFEDDFDDDPE